jgi:hypothetical protein
MSIQQESMAEYTRLLEAVAEAKKTLQAVQATGQQEAIYKADWAVTEATANLNSFQGDVGLYWIHGMRWAESHYPNHPIAKMLEVVHRVDALEAVVLQMSEAQKRKGVQRG